MRRTHVKKRKSKRRTTRRKLARKRGGAVYPLNRYQNHQFPEREVPMNGGAFDTRYTFSQPLANVWDSSMHGVSNVVNTFMGRSQDVNPDVTSQPYLR